MSVFLQREDIRALTGRKQACKQIAALKAMHIPHYVNAVGNPVVALSVVTGNQTEKIAKKWTPPPAQ
jgi:hypothetical protein